MSSPETGYRECFSSSLIFPGKYSKEFEQPHSWLVEFQDLGVSTLLQGMPLYGPLLLGSFLSIVDQLTPLLPDYYPVNEEKPRTEIQATYISTQVSIIFPG